MNYGLPYKGSKNKIAKEIVDQLPAAKHFYDLFAGGCAVTHAAMLSGKYETFTINDIHPQIVQLFVDAVNGKYRDEKRIISREEFYRLKDSDPYVAFCWSFGNNGRDYLWSSKNEKAKLLACKMILADSVKERWQAYWDFIKYLQSVRTELQRRRENKERIRVGLGDEDLERLKRLQSLYSLERLQSLEGLECLQSLEGLTGDYQSIAIMPNSVVYCDPPYRDTSDYKTAFDYDRFYDWLRSVPFPVYVSEYAMPDDFVQVWQKEKICRLSAYKNTRTTERLFLHRKWAEQHQPTREPDLFSIAGKEGE